MHNSNSHSSATFVGCVEGASKYRPPTSASPSPGRLGIILNAKWNKTISGILIVALSFVLFPGTGSSSTFYLGGIQVNEPDHRKWINTLKQENMNTIAATTYAYHGEWDTDQLYFRKENPGLIEEIRAAKAQGVKAVLILRTALDHAYPKNKFLWHGMIMPMSDEALENWFAKYTEFVSYWAAVAQREGVDILGIASEMNTLTSTLPVKKIPKLQEWYLNRLKQIKMKARLLEHDDVISKRHLWVRGHENYSTVTAYLDDRQQAHKFWARQTAFSNSDDPVARINDRRRRLDNLWRELIDQTRRIYHGKLTYAANFDQYHEVGFWDALDLMGINAYFQLRKDLLDKHEDRRMEAILRQGWQNEFEKIDQFCTQHNLRKKPILFTELGYTRRKNCTIEPWADTGFSIIGAPADKKLIVWQDQPEDPNERALAIKALYRATRNRSLNPLIGILYWKLSTLPSHRDIEPFVCILDNPPKDPLLKSLQLFRTNAEH